MYASPKQAPRLMLLTLVLSIVLVALVSCKKDPTQNLQNKHAPELQAILDSLHKVEAAQIESLHHIPRIVTATVKRGQGLYQVLGQADLDNKAMIKIIAALSDSVEFTKLRVGESFQIGLDPLDAHKVLSFRYSPNRALSHNLALGPDGNFIYTKIERPTTTRYHVYEGELQKGTNLGGVLRTVGVNPRMINVVTGVLMCKVAFNLAHPGDKFKVLVQERLFQDSVFIEGTVLYAQFSGKLVGTHEAFNYDDGDPKSTFNAHYTEDGEALIFSGLRYPLDLLHISCGYGMRLHPITGLHEMHNGVDYSAAPGTAVYAVAEGTVIVSDFDPLSGNKIAIQHKDKSSSWYLHLSVRGVNKGQHVVSRQVIARSGNTGRSTGPHLHFGFKQPNGAWMNPLTKRMIATPKLEGDRLQKLHKQIKDIRAILANPPKQ